MASAPSDPKRAERVRELMKHRSSLFAFILSVVRDFALAEEVMQEVAVSVCESPEESRPGSSFGARAAGIARATIVTLCRERGREIPLGPEAIEGIARAAQAEPAANWLEAVRPCLEEAGGKTRSVLAMRYRQGMSGPEIARRTKSTAAAIHLALSRARSALARCVEGRLASERE